MKKQIPLFFSFFIVCKFAKGSVPDRVWCRTLSAEPWHGRHLGLRGEQRKAFWPCLQSDFGMRNLTKQSDQSSSLFLLVIPHLLRRQVDDPSSAVEAQTGSREHLAANLTRSLKEWPFQAVFKHGTFWAGKYILAYTYIDIAYPHTPHTPIIYVYLYISLPLSSIPVCQKVKQCDCLELGWDWVE